MSTRTQRVRVLRAVKATDTLVTAHREHQAILHALTARDSQLAASAAASTSPPSNNRYGTPPRTSGPTDLLLIGFCLGSTPVYQCRFAAVPHAGMVTKGLSASIDDHGPVAIVRSTVVSPYLDLLAPVGRVDRR